MSDLVARLVEALDPDEDPRVTLLTSMQPQDMSEEERHAAAYTLVSMLDDADPIRAILRGVSGD